MKALAAALLASWAAAAGAPHGRADRAYYYEQIFQPFFQRRGDEYRSSRPGSSPGSFAAVKAANGLRVFVIGGSIANRYMSSPDGGDLGRALALVLPSRRVEALNCGMNGYDSYREAMLVEEALEHQPDLIVLMTGHNEAIASPPVPLWTLHAADRLSRLRAFRALVAELRPGVDPGAAPDAARRRDEAFERNLTSMIRKARAAGVVVAVVSPPLNYRDAPSQAPLPAEDPRFVAGWLRRLRGDDAGAVAAWSALGAGPSYAGALFYRARALERLGRLEAARSDYRAALAADADLGGRCGPRCRRIMRGVAAREGAVWVDVDGAFLRRARPGLPGLDMFQDTVHWRHAYDAMVSAAIVGALRAAPDSRKWPWSRAGLAALRRSAAAPAGPPSLEDDLATLRYALVELRRSDGRLSARGLAFLSAVEERRPGWFAGPEALLRRASSGGRIQWPWSSRPLELAPAPGMLAWHLGELRLERGQLEPARALLARAVAEEPRLSGARLDLAAAQAWSGRAGQAAEQLDAAAAGGGAVAREAAWYRAALLP